MSLLWLSLLKMKQNHFVYGGPFFFKCCTFSYHLIITFLTIQCHTLEKDKFHQGCRSIGYFIYFNLLVDILVIILFWRTFNKLCKKNKEFTKFKWSLNDLDFEFIFICAEVIFIKMSNNSHISCQLSFIVLVSNKIWIIEVFETLSCILKYAKHWDPL